MSNLTLDGSTSFIGTEFIKLLATGSSHLATEEYVDDAIEQGGGGGNVDLSNYYTQTETDNLLNNKLNVNNPQDIIGNLRLDPTNGNSKLIINAVSPPTATDDFYCNGTGHFNGSLRVSVLTSDGDVNADGCNADTFNSHITTNDIVFKHNDVEYMRFNATDDTIDLSKELNLGSSTLKINSLNTNGLNDMTFSVDTLGEFLRFNISDFTVRVPNNRSFLSQNIFTDIIKPIAFGNDMICYGSNAADSGYIEYWKLNHAAETIDFSKVLRCNEINTLTETNLIIKRYGTQKMNIGSAFVEFSGGVHCGNQLVIDTAKLLTLAPYAFGGFNYFDIRNNHTTNPMIRLRCGLTGEITCMEITPSFVNFKKDITIENTVRLKTNTIDTNDDNDLVFKRNDVQFFALDKFTEDTIEKEAIICSKQLRANGQLLVNNLQINQFSVGVEYTDFRLENVDSVMRFYVGNGTNANLTITNSEITLGRVANCNGGLKTNTINSNGNNDLLFQRNSITYFKLSLTNKIITVENDAGLSSPDLFANEFLNRTRQYDTVFWGSHPTADSRVEYMRYNYAGESLDFNTVIDNTGLAVIGNIVDTTVSDKKLKKNINDIITDASKVVKNVNTKTFEYKDEKHGKGVQFGFVANDLLEELPDVFSKIVGQDKDGNYNINHIKLSVILWKALQEQILKNEEKDYKIEHLEARLFEVEDIIKDLKGKKTTKPKAKAKSKAKSEK